jgi:ribosomal protein S18 acetylase RimI-like enzyme
VAEIPVTDELMAVIQLRDKGRIERFLRRHPDLHVYSIGDLDDFFWPHTRWLACEEAGNLKDIVLVYTGKTLPTVIGLSDRPGDMRQFFEQIRPLLPERFHAHLSLGVEKALKDRAEVVPHGGHWRMALRDASAVRAVACPGVEQLTEADLDAVLSFYEQSYPGNWFDERMLKTGQYFGLRQNGRLVSVAGVHVYSRRFRVGALGNIATGPAWRNRGYGKRVTARVCQALLEHVDHIGLNVKADNGAALRCYESLGFEIIASYGEFNVGPPARGC